MLKKYFSADKGFSLVELLVAITILGIASATVAHSFITSSRITQKSKIFGEATAAANNIAEAVDAFSLEDFLAGNAVQMLGFSSEDVGNHLFKQDDMCAAITGITSGNSQYDAVIHYSEGDALADVDSDDYGIYELNNYDIAQYTEMDGSFTQSWMPDQNPDYLADVYFKDEATSNMGIIGNDNTGALIAESDLSLHFKNNSNKYPFKRRLISVNVYTDTTGNVYMDVVYNYTYTYYYRVTVGGYLTDDVDVSEFVWTYTSSVTFNQDDSSMYKPESDDDEITVFIMYYPHYGSMSRIGSRYSQYDINPDRANMTDSYYDLEYWNNYIYGNASNNSQIVLDTIVINNLGNVPTKFFIVKQRAVDDNTSEPTDDNGIRSLEVRYRAQIIERLTNSELLSPQKNQIYTNAGVQLNNPDGKNYYFYGYKQIVNMNTLRDSLTVQQYLNTLQAEDYMKKDLVYLKEDTRYYKVTVDVYPAGTVSVEEISSEEDDESGETLYNINVDDANAIYSFIGSKLE